MKAYKYILEIQGRGLLTFSIIFLVYLLSVMGIGEASWLFLKLIILTSSLGIIVEVMELLIIELKNKFSSNKF